MLIIMIRKLCDNMQNYNFILTFLTVDITYLINHYKLSSQHLVQLDGCEMYNKNVNYNAQIKSGIDVQYVHFKTTS